MDNDDLRRGVPTCHVQYDEATAILAGDALQALAFETLTSIKGLSSENTIELLHLLSSLGGCSGMATGQAIDLASTGQQLSVEQLSLMHQHKTGALIEASVLMGAIATGKATAEQCAALKQFARCIGLAFQIQDDIIDIESSTQLLGKQQGADAANNKATYPSLMGLDAAKEKANSLYTESIDALAIFGDKADPLRTIARFIINRDY
jgi:geranylgeranyl pyrophosphate synthase